MRRFLTRRSPPLPFDVETSCIITSSRPREWGKGLGICLGFRYAVPTPGTVSHRERH